MKIVIGGQLAKEELLKAVQNSSDETVEVTTASDSQAAMEVKAGKVDYYIGCCHTGGGGSLAMAIALCGYNSCCTISSAGKVMSNQEIADAVKSGKKCFGLVPESIDNLIPILVKEMISFKA